MRGSGIGLAVADEIVRLHGGALDIQSQEDVGTTVTISLPTCSHLEADPQLTENTRAAKIHPRKEPVMENPKKITTIGGQALMEGIMMVGPKRTVAAFCDEEGNISTEEISVPRLTKQYPLLGKPFIRGHLRPGGLLPHGLQGAVPLRGQAHRGGRGGGALRPGQVAERPPGTRKSPG